MSHAKYGKDIAEFVRKFREDQGLTMKALGELLGVSEQYVWNIENTYNSNFPLKFSARLLKVVDEGRQKYLTDLILELTLQSVEKNLGVTRASPTRKRKPTKRKPKK